MKLFITIALFVTVAVAAAASDNLHVHLHMDKPITDKRFSGFVSKFMQSMTDKKNVEVHFHVPSGNDNDEIQLSIWDKAKELAEEAARKAKEAAEEAARKLKEAAEEAARKAKEAAEEAARKAEEAAKQAEEEAKKLAEKGFDAAKHSIEEAVHKTEDAFNKVKSEIQSIHLPHIDIGNLIEPIMNIVQIVEKLIPCAKTLKSAIPKFIEFAKAAAKDDAAGAVQSLMATLQYMPDISSNCIGKVFTIPPNVMNKIQCAADIVGLVAPIVSFIAEPENVINDVNGVKSIIELLPQTISDCTGAFA